MISDKSDNIILYDSQEYVFGFSLLNDSFLDIHNLKLSIYGYKKDNYKVSLDELDLNNLIELELNDIKVDKQDFDKYSFLNNDDGDQDKFSSICKISFSEKKHKICIDNQNKSNNFKSTNEEYENSLNSNFYEKNRKETYPILPKSKKMFLTYYYRHLKKYKFIEFKLSLNSKNETSKITSYFSIKKEIISELIMNLKPISITPIVSDPIIFDNLLKLEERINSNYGKYICSNKYFVCFSFKNLCLNKLNIYSCITSTSNEFSSQCKSNSFKGNNDKETIIKKDVCESGEVKNINLLINSDVSGLSLNESSLKYSFIRWINSVNSNISGKIEVKQIFKDFNIQLNEVFRFSLTKTITNNEGIIECDFRVLIENLTKKQFTNLTLKLFLFKTNNLEEDNIMIMQTKSEKQYLFNEEIEDLLYEGQLIHQLNIEPNSNISFNVTSFLFLNEEINFTCLILDDLCKLVYICPIFINHKYI